MTIKTWDTTDAQVLQLASGVIWKREILLQDTPKMHNMLMDTVKTRIYPKTPQIRGSLPRHTAPIILIISQICGERRWVK